MVLVQMTGTPSSILLRKEEESRRRLGVIKSSFLHQSMSAFTQLAANKRSWPFFEIGATLEVMQLQDSPLSSLQKTSPPVVPPKMEQLPFDSSRQSAPNSCFKLLGSPPPSRCQFFPASLLRKIFPSARACEPALRQVVGLCSAVATNI